MYLCMLGISNEKEMRRIVSTFDYVTCKRVDTRGDQDICNRLLLVSSILSHLQHGECFLNFIETQWLLRRLHFRFCYFVTLLLEIKR